MNYAERALEQCLLSKPDDVRRLLLDTLSAIRPYAIQELDVMQESIKHLAGDRTMLNLSDIPYMQWWVRYSKFEKYFEENLENYFSVVTLIEGFASLCHKLYGITLENCPISIGEVWSEDVRKLNVSHDKHGRMGTIYLDLIDRPSKSGGDCHYTIKCAKLMQDGSYQLPVVVVSLHMSANETPTLASHSQAANLFHELGHAMHSILGRTKYQHSAGTRCSTDLAEVPSNLMEIFFYDPRVLSEMALHYQTRKPLSLVSIDNLVRSKKAFTALDMQTQAFYSLFDLNLHSDSDRIIRENIPTSYLLEELHNKWLSVPFISDTAWHHKFTHLVPYAAKYHSYIVAKSISSLIWDKCFQDDPYCRVNGNDWAEVQSHGGELPTPELLYKVLGYVPTINHMVDVMQKQAQNGIKALNEHKL